ncbi:23S rRNA (adenine(2503)-C(2))-methyltransferase RlmN [Thiosocius teredinicola]|uniref:23S rRNA (adenine(2503)-C(2))-methyltransferase RlmN n=1 Tax=Thiosocius teredinicola TaxID=1973002 RepID=UPI0009913BA1
MTEAPKTNLVGLTKSAIEAYFVGLGAKAFHGRNVLKWIHKHGVIDFDAMTDVPQKLRDQLKQQAEIVVPKIALVQPARDGTTKWVLELADGQHIETVHIPEDNRDTICVSSQVGCALDCSFCSTAQQGFNRNLTTDEIIGQVWLATRELGRIPTNVVMMGMGEPLANIDNVVPAMDLMQEDLAYMISKARVTLSTSGIVPALNRLRDLSDVSLAVSLHAPDNELRDQLVPINRKYPLEQLIPACKNFISSDKRRKITWEYVMLDGVNDSISHAKALIRLLQGVPSKVNLIPFNPFPGSDYRTSPEERVEAFRQRLKRAGIIATTRKTRGEDIDAACGQLVGKVRDRSRRQFKRIPVVQEHVQ